MYSEIDISSIQRTGVDFLVTPHETFKWPHRMLAWDMGLGKTPVTICALTRLQPKSTLIICPATQRAYWAKQLVDWGYCSAENIFVFRSAGDVAPANLRVYVASYGIFSVSKSNNFLAWVRGRKFSVLVVDESQYLKDPFAKRTCLILGGGKQQSVASRCKHIWLLTGTPAPNHIIDLFAPLRTLASPLICGKLRFEDFGFYFCGGRKDEYGNMLFKGGTNLDELFEAIKPFCYILKSGDSGVEMPEVIIRDIPCDVEMAADESNTDPQTLRMEIGLEKIPFVVNHVCSILQTKVDKVMVVCYNTAVISQLFLEFAGKVFIEKTFVINGSVPQEKRPGIIKDFTKLKGKSILLIQQDAAGIGTDGIQKACNYMVEVQPEWQPGKTNQVIGRIKRFGQFAKTVFVDRILCVNTQDGYIDGSRKKKEKTIDKLIKTNRRVYMSLEEAIKENTAAVKQLIDALGNGNVASVKSTSSGSKSSEKSSEKLETAAKTEKKATLEDCVAATKNALGVLTTALGTKEKAKAEISNIRDKHGAKKVEELKPKAFAGYIKDIEDLVNEALTSPTGDDDEPEEDDDAI